jgi:hypothetical protein
VGVLEHADRAPEQRHACFLLAGDEVGVPQRSGVPVEGLLHQVHPDQGVIVAGKVADPDLDLLHRGEHGKLWVAEQELVADLAGQARVQFHAEPLLGLQAREPVGLGGDGMASAGDEHLLGAAAGLAGEQSVGDQPCPGLADRAEKQLVVLPVGVFWPGSPTGNRIRVEL